MFYKILKRSFDIIGAALGLSLLAPFIPFLYAAIKLDSSGPFLVRLARISNRKQIWIYKFRSMIDGAHEMRPTLAAKNERADGPFFKIKNDPRITSVGRILRKFRIDEFPQLINVLKGEMSLVGPRPHEPEEVVLYPGEHQHLVLAKAGVTGLSQVNGASSLPFRQELELDTHYIRNQSLMLDAKILAKTIKIFFSDPTAV